MKTLYLYSACSTYTNTVHEHIAAFQRYSNSETYYLDVFPSYHTELNFSNFDVVVLHYTVRLPFDQIAGCAAQALTKFEGLKVLFIQDEYDHTEKAWCWIKQLGIGLVFTVVPSKGIQRVYPAEQFPGVRFVSNLTGYVPEVLPYSENGQQPPSQRDLLVGYRGRPLPLKYGRLGQEKVDIGRMVQAYCESHALKHDIAWTEEKRIYGPAWYDFMASCRAMLGSESGSNVFDWDGTLAERATALSQSRRGITDEKIYSALIAPLEIPGLMNQISPRVFEAIAARTVLVLFEGSYSGVVEPGVHFIPLKKDGSNLAEVFELLRDPEYVDAMAQRAYADVVGTGRYSYQSFVRMVDEEIAVSLKELRKAQEMALKGHRPHRNALESMHMPSAITRAPLRASPPPPRKLKDSIWLVAAAAWMKIPEHVRMAIKPYLKIILGRR